MCTAVAELHVVLSAKDGVVNNWMTNALFVIKISNRIHSHRIAQQSETKMNCMDLRLALTLQLTKVELSTSLL